MNDYNSLYAAQIPVLGEAGQQKLSESDVVVVGNGRLGSAIAIILAAAGVCRFVLIDPQRFSPDNSNCLYPTTKRDRGKLKVDLLACFLMQRTRTAVRRFAVGIESPEPEIHDAIASSDLVISTPNDWRARCVVARKVITVRKPLVDAAVADGREALAGVVKVWLPEQSDGACPGCYFLHPVERDANEGLLATVIGTIAGIAANLAAQILSGVPWQPPATNYFAVELSSYQMEAMAVRRRVDCEICGSSRRQDAELT